MTTIRVGMFGLGTVGLGVVKYLREYYDYSKTLLDIDITKICVRDSSKQRKVDIDPALLTTNPDDILENPSIDVVVEVMGGIEPAGAYIVKALENKKHVVTANKALLAYPSGDQREARSPEEFAALIDAGKWPKSCGGNLIFIAALTNKKNIGFEASVCGEIPIIDVVSAMPSSSAVIALEGIINGTSNYILTKMAEGKNYKEALQEAQENGFAEADPSFDTDGMDAAQKLTLLSTLIFGELVEVPRVARESIGFVTAEDIKYTRNFGYVIKPIASARKHNGDLLELRVCPTLVSETDPLASVNNETNAVSIYLGDRNDPLTLIGKGAGMMPTASSIVTDIVRVVKESHESRFSIYNLFTCFPESPVKTNNQFESPFYLRLNVEDRPRVASGITTVLGENDININSLQQQQSDKKGDYIPIALLLGATKEANLDRALEEIKKRPYVQGYLKLRIKN